MISFLQVENLTKSYGETILFTNITFGVNKDEKIGLIARNGTGKTSLLNIIAGMDTADSGKISFKRDLTIGYLPQEPLFDDTLNVLQQVFKSSNEIVKTIEDYEAAINNHDKDKLSTAIEEMDRLQAWDFELKIKQILSKLKIEDLAQPVKELSGGQKKRLALANVLINNPDLLILDEPTNHLDTEMIEWLEEYIEKSGCTLLMVTHDRYFLDRICNEIIEIDDNKVFQYQGNYSYFIEKRDERIQLLSTNIAKANNLMKKELEWVRKMPKARGTKAKYRVENFYKIKEQASQKIDNRKVDMDIQSKRLGSKVLEIKNLTKKFDNKTIIENFSYSMTPYEKIGIVGKNGTGKSTFLNLITDNLQADSGIIEMGETISYAYYKQTNNFFKENQRVIEIIKEISEDIWLGDGKRLSPSQFLEHFLFPTEMQYNMIAKLSGGEKRRLYLMTVLMRNPNFLILDEPTNDLDIMTLTILEDYIRNFKGNVLIVSHDRYFMDKIVDNLFIFEGNGKIDTFSGNYSDYSAWQFEKEKEDKKQQREEKKSEKEKNTIVASKETTSGKKPTFKEKREYEQLGIDIQNLEKEKSILETEINSGNLKTEELINKSNRIGEILSLLEEKEMRWLELSEFIEN